MGSGCGRSNYVGRVVLMYCPLADDQCMYEKCIFAYQRRVDNKTIMVCLIREWLKVQLYRR